MNRSLNVRQEIAVLLISGKSLSDIQKETGENISTIRSVADRIGWDKDWEGSDENSRKEIRSKTIINLVAEEKMNLREVGDIYNISRERVRQILKTKDVNIRTLRNDKIEMVFESLLDLLLTGNYSYSDAAAKLKITNTVLAKAKKLITPEQMRLIKKAKYKIKKEKDKAFMSTAIKMWRTHTVEEITSHEDYGISVAYMNQLIIKFRNKYNWFPLKRISITEEKITKAAKE